MTETAPVDVTSASLVGVWRRELIRWPDGRTDTSTRVTWVQATRCYADVRVPADRPDFGSVQALVDCSAEQVRWLATQQGFAGELSHTNGAYQWLRHIDYQPPSGRRDIGRLRYLDPARTRMAEDGVDEPYHEVWLRTDDRGEPVVLRPEHGRGLFVASGGHFMLAIDRRPRPLPPAESLLDLLSAGMEPAALLDMELSLGRIGGPIELSTLPWREGQPVGPLDGWQVIEGSPEHLRRSAGLVA